MADDASPINERVSGAPSTGGTHRSGNILGKLGLIGLIMLLLQIPLWMVQGVIDERQEYNTTVNQEIASTWAQDQIIKGPVLAVPVKRKKDVIEWYYILPETLSITGSIKPEVRYRGIFESVVYTSNLQADGYFSLSDFKKRNIPAADILWKDAFVSLGISDSRGINKPAFTWKGINVELVPGVNGMSLYENGMYTPVPVDATQTTYPYSVTMDLNGSKTLQFIPVGKQSKLDLSSSWDSPSFIGGFLPTTRTVNQDGFKAHWDVSYFARSFPQITSSLMDNNPVKSGMSQAQIGVSLITPVDFYQQTKRSVKYGILFLVLTFITYFLFEITASSRVHGFHYILVGLALCLFYLLLISLSEIIGFLPAYVSATIPTIAMIALYTKAISKSGNRKMPWVIAAILAVLYTYLYVLLQQEDYALLLGSIGLFIVLAIVMYVTRNIDWYGSNQAQD